MMRDEFKNEDNWYKHFLPHYDTKNKYQTITYRLSDSLAQSTLGNLGSPQSSAGKKDDLERRTTIEQSLDKGYGSCILSKPDIALKVIDTWKYYHLKHYELIAYVVMPNHVHVMIKTLGTRELGKIVWAWKSYVAKYVFSIEEYKALFQKSFSKRETYNGKSRIPEDRSKHFKPAEDCGEPRIRLWHREYWDRFIRNEIHFKKALEYIHMNPVKAGLVKQPEDWKWTSCH